MKRVVKRGLGILIIVAATIGAATFLRGDSVQAWTHADLDPSGDWSFMDDASAAGGRALVNRADATTPVLVLANLRVRDLKASTRCKVTDVPGACGIAFRYVDPKNYWLARARLDDTLRAIDVIAVVNGKENVVGIKPLGRPLSEWVTVAIDVQGDAIRVTVAADQLIAQSTTLPASVGTAGVWASSEATVSFDHLMIEAKTSSPRALEILPLLGRKS